LKAHLFKEHNFEIKSNKEVKNCELCLIAVSSKGLLRKHLKEKHYSGDKKCCPYCDYKSLQSWQSLKYHIDYRHSDMREKKYFCDTCSEGFIYEDSVIIHKNTKHLKHVCHICGNEYTSESGLKEHMIIEHKIGSEIKNWICETCAYSAPTKKSLQIHNARKHAVDKHKKYPHCDYHSNAMHQMHVHIDSKHPEHDKKTFNCDHCSRSFIFKASLKKHLENQRTMARNRDKKNQPWADGKKQAEKI